MNKKIMFIDLENTLLGTTNNISIENVTAIHNLKQKGIPTVITTSRRISTVVPIAKQINALPFVISDNGAIVKNINTDENIFIKTIDIDKLSQIIKIAISNSIYLILNTENNYLIQNVRYGLIPGKKLGFTLVPSLEQELRKQDIFSCQIIGNSLDYLNTVKQNIEELDLLTTEIKLFPVEEMYKQSPDEKTYIFYIYPKNINFQEAIEKLLDNLELEKEESVSIGGSLNYTDVFKATGYKIAMKNAPDELKQQSDLITLSNDENGVANAIKVTFNL